MPNYKVVDADQLDSAMTATADAIREKTESTEQIVWDTTKGFADAVNALSLTDDIENEVDTQSDLIAQIKTLLATKQSSGSSDDGSGGGGLPGGVTALASGTYTAPTVNIPASPIGIEHGLGTTPNFFFIFAEGEPQVYSDFYYCMVAQFGLAQAFSISTSPNLGAFRILRYGSSNGFSQTVSNGTMSGFADDSVFFVYNSSTYQVKPGTTYRWIAGVIEGI